MIVLSTLLIVSGVANGLLFIFSRATNKILIKGMFLLAFISACCGHFIEVLGPQGELFKVLTLTISITLGLMALLINEAR